jgi:FKBP12-rapamycin complex-associated protein
LKFELIEHEVKRAFELLASERSEGKQYAAVLILREIAYSMPTFFFQNVSKFFDVIFFAVWDQKTMLREAAVNALRVCWERHSFSSFITFSLVIRPVWW